MKKILRNIALSAGVLLAVGCSDDYLDTFPTDSASKDAAMSTPENMMLAINGIHRDMYAQGGIISSYAGEQFIMPYLEYSAGDALHSTEGNGWFRSCLRWVAHTNQDRFDVSWVWFHYYNMIANANNIIEASEGMTEDGLLANVLGQAYAYRAYGHYRLVQLWGNDYLVGSPSTDPGVPIMLPLEGADEGEARATVGEVYAQIEADLAMSMQYFGNPDVVYSSDKSNITMNVVNGLAARVALSMGKWSEAAAYADKAMMDYSLMSEAEYKSGFNNVGNPEWIWGAHVTDDQTTYYRSFFYYIGTNFNGSQNRGNPKFINNNLFAQIADTDYRKEMWLPTAPNTIVGWEADPNYDSEDAFWDAYADVKATYQLGSHNTYPYMSVKFRNADGPTISPDDVLYMRVSEMYLLKAEAQARAGQDAEAAQTLYDLVSTRDSGYMLSANTGSALLEEIKLHRRIELWGEGHRFLDMKRWDEDLDLTGSGASSTLYQGGFAQPRHSVNPLWLWKIPSQEINANPLINLEHQNPGDI